MKKFIAAAAMSAILVSPAFATDPNPEPQKVFEIESPDVDVKAEGPEIVDYKWAKKRERYLDVTYYNIADITQVGFHNVADIYQNEGGYHSQYNLNGSWTMQTGAFNTHFGSQNAFNSAWNLAKVEQIGAGNYAYTDQLGYDYGQNLLKAGQLGAFNSVIIDQDISGGTYDYYGSPSVNVLSTVQIGAFNSASVTQGAYNGGGNFGEVVQVGAANSATLRQFSNQ